MLMSDNFFYAGALISGYQWNLKVQTYFEPAFPFTAVNF